MISLKYVFRKVYVILNVRDSYMCVNVFEVKIVKSVWKRVSSEFEKWIAFSTLLRHKMVSTLTSGKLVTCGSHTHTKKKKKLLQNDKTRLILDKAEKEDFSVS